jgi:hypothetical protein
MITGAGILRSAVHWGLVVLRLFTTVGWQRKAPTARAVRGIIVAGVVIAGGLCACGENQNRLQPPADFWGLSLALTKPDITRLKGVPAHVAPVSTMNPAGELWIYPPENSDPKLLAEGELPLGSYLVHFSGEKISRIEYYGRNPATAPVLMGVRAGDSLDAVARRLGTASRVSNSADKLAALVSYEKFRVFYSFRQNQIEAYGLYNPEFGPVEIGTQ